VVRDRSAVPVSPALPCRIALMGDSFTEAGQVRYEASYGGMLEERATGRCEVRNYGVRSYSPSIYLVQWEHEVKAWQPTHVFVMLFGNDVADDRIYLQTAVRDGRGFPTAIQGPAGGWLTAQLRKLYIARYVRATTQKWEWSRAHAGQPIWTVGGQAEENPDWPEESARLIRELSTRVAASSARFTLMTVPSRYRLMGDGTVPVGELDFHEKIQRWAAAESIPFLPLSPAFERARGGEALYFLQDIHFTEAGHRVAADEITRSFPDLFQQPK
jgi:lysophospholipase L1-like esterase